MLKATSFKGKNNSSPKGVTEGNQEGLGTGLAFNFSKRWPDI
jgi:hypothetical protein